jgi:CHAD domain-containing protein
MELALKRLIDEKYARAPVAVKASALPLSPDMSVEQAFQAIALNCVTHMHANAEAVANSDDVECLHQMRVAIRRLRSALDMFKRLLRLPDAMQSDLDWLDQQLGDARDWDVLTGTTLPELARSLSDRAQLDKVVQAAADQAHDYHVAAAAAAGSRRCTRLLQKLARWVQTMGWRRDRAAGAAPGEQLAKPVAKFARKILKRQQRRLRRSAAQLQAATPQARHRVRIAAKKTRYAAEFFACLFASKSMRAYIRRLTGLQEALGLSNDAIVADRLLAKIASSQPRLEASACFARGFLAARASQHNKSMVKQWNRFAPCGLPLQRE